MQPRLRAEELESREVPAAGSTLVNIASGTGWSLSINTYGRVAVMQVDQAEFNKWANQSTTNTTTLADEAAISQRLYSVLPDVFDFITVVPNIPLTTANLLGYDRPVRAIATGTGQGSFDFSSLYGSAGQLSAFMYQADLTQLRGGTGDHEIMHQWANDLPNMGLPVGANSGGHWGYSDVGGALGGWQKGTLQSLGGTRYVAHGPNGNVGWADNDNTGTTGTLYAPIELYLMGLIPASEVPDITYAINGRNLNPFTGEFEADGFATITSAQIVAALGERSPVPYNAERNFRGITVLLTPGGVTQAQLDQMDTQVELFAKGGSDNDPTNWNFWESTGGRATLQWGGLNEFIPHNSGLVNSFLAIGGDNLREIGYSSRGSNGYDTSKPVIPNFADLLGDAGGEIRTVMSDVNGDTIPDFIVATGPGSITRFGVYNGVLNDGWVITPMQPFRGSEDFTGGAFVSAGDLDGNGFSEIVVTADTGGGPRVVMYSFRSGSGVGVVADFLGIGDTKFRGGARSAIGDINGDGSPELVVAAGTGGGPRISVYDGKTLFTTRTHLMSDFFAFPGADATRLRNGVYLATGDLNGDGFDDLVFGGGPGGAPRVLALSGAQLLKSVTQAQNSPLASFFVAGNANDRGGVRVATKNVDGDVRADLVVGSGENTESHVRIYRGSSFPARGEPTPLQDIDPFGSIMPGGVYVG